MSHAEGPRALYESMSTATLRELRHAFELDQANHTANGTLSAFCAHRIALIDSVLAARQASDPQEDRR
jgi:hypothetical protein